VTVQCVLQRISCVCHVFSHLFQCLLSYEQAMTKFVANDAFNQALTNPLLSQNVWENGEETFGKYGWEVVKQDHTVRDLLERNIPNDLGDAFIGMTIPTL